MAVQSHPQTVVVFGLYRLDLANLELTKDGRRIRLPHQPTRVLAFLAGRPGEIVTREALQGEIWKTDTFVDFEHALNNCIKQIRATLGDNASDPRFIETVPKTGYRFIAKAEFESSTARQTQAADRTGSGNRASASPSVTGDRVSPTIAAVTAPIPAVRRQARGLLLAACAVILGLVGWLFLKAQRRPQFVSLRQVTHYGRAEYTTEMVTDGVRIYFMERNGGKWDIAQVSVAGGEPMRVPTPFKNSTLFDISPDGSELLVGSFEGDEKELLLWELPVLGGGPRRLGNLRGQSAAWSPDGRTLVYGFRREISIANADGSQPRRIASVSGRADFFRWSPDGRVVRFMQWDPTDTSVTLWEMYPNGSHLRMVVAENAPPKGWLDGECPGGWSADGKYYLYRSSRSNGMIINAIPEAGNLFGLFNRSPVRLYVDYSNGFCGVLPARKGDEAYFVAMRETRQLVRYDGKLQQYDPYLSGIAARSVNVSPDGRWIAYISSTDGTLWRSAIDGTNRRHLTFPPESAESPKWSPDSKAIVYAMATPGKSHGIYISPGDGDHAQTVTDGEYEDEAPSWSPSADAIIFERFKLGVGRIGTYSFDLKTRQLSKVDVPARLAWMRWSPDGRYAYSAADSPRSSVPEQLGALYLFDKATNHWSEVANASFLNIAGWTPDSKYIYYQDMYGGETQPVFRVRVSDRKVQRLTAENLSLPADITAYTLIGIAPDGAPLACAIRKNSDIYAMAFKP